MTALDRHAIDPTTYDLPDPEEPLMTEPTIPAEASRQAAERRAGVYDNDDNPCDYCDYDPCACDDIYEHYREFDHDEY